VGGSTLLPGNLILLRLPEGGKVVVYIAGT